MQLETENITVTMSLETLPEGQFYVARYSRFKGQARNPNIAAALLFQAMADECRDTARLEREAANG